MLTRITRICRSEMASKHCLLILLLSSLEVADFAVSTTKKDIYNAIISGYTKEVRPVSTTNYVLNIEIMGYLLAINDFDEVAGTLETVIVLGLKWTDEALVWDLASYDNVTHIIIPQSKVWAPDLFNVKSANTFVPIGGGNFKVNIMYNGDVRMLPGGIMKIKCSPDVAKFPFDVQVCSLEVLPWMYMSNDINFTAVATELDYTYYELNGEWTVEKTEIKTVLKTGYPFVIISLTLSRLPLYHIMNTLIPVYFLGFLNPLVFILPCDCGERSGYTLTMLLSYTVFMMVINSALPQTSSPMAVLSFVTFGALVFSGFITVLNSFQLRMYHRDDDVPVHPWLVRLVTILSCSGRRKVKPDITEAMENDSVPRADKGGAVITWKTVVNVLDMFYMKLIYVTFTIGTVSATVYLSSM
ncbi:neuronal acetylcholine receptor subunit alpha-7-like [Argopecten irradians]|uniref:neuronal acetylcholine receptor subunit alpha-7-like n=1 Tax=Argopecten irradians TaxID=31199 RepID=UPI003719803B